MIPELELYRMTAAILAVVTLGTVVTTARVPARHRQYGLIGVVIAVSMTTAYALMSMEVLTIQNLEGEQLPAARFGAYMIAFAAMLSFLPRIADVGYRWIAVVVVLLVGVISGTIASWYLQEPESLAATVVIFGSLIALSVVLLRSLPRRFGDLSDERRLLFGKLRNLTLLIWWLYIVLGLITRQNLGLLDAFVGVFLGAYLDIVITVGFVAIMLRADTALDQLAVQDGSSVGGDGGSGGADGGSDREEGASEEPAAVTPSPAE